MIQPALFISMSPPPRRQPQTVPLSKSWPIYTGVVTCGLFGLLFLISGTFLLLFAGDAFLRGQIFIVLFENYWWGSKISVIFAIIAIVDGLLHLLAGYWLFNLEDKGRVWSIMLFSFHLVMTLPTVIGLIAYGSSLYGLIFQDSTKALFYDGSYKI